MKIYLYKLTYYTLADFNAQQPGHANNRGGNNRGNHRQNQKNYGAENHDNNHDGNSFNVSKRNIQHEPSDNGVVSSSSNYETMNGSNGNAPKPQRTMNQKNGRRQ